MAIMAQWNGKSWEVSQRRIAALNSVAASVKLKTDNKDDAAGSPATTSKGLELQNFSFEFALSSAAGVDVRSEYESWVGLLGGSAPFYLGGRRFGPESVMLTGVSLDNTTLNDFGTILQGTIAINLTEDAPEASAKKSSGKSKTTAISGKSTPAVATYSELGLKSSAASVGATAANKAAKKPTNPQLNK
ncbi:MAG: hypothetical protein WHF31_12470 [Candidatus Dehalobacter alkaniphilus]